MSSPKNRAYLRREVRTNRENTVLGIIDLEFFRKSYGFFITLVVSQHCIGHYHIINSYLVICYRRTIVLPVTAFDSRMRFLQELRGSFSSAILNLGKVLQQVQLQNTIPSSRMMQPMTTYITGLPILDARETNTGFCQMR